MQFYYKATSNISRFSSLVGKENYVKQTTYLGYHFYAHLQKGHFLNYQSRASYVLIFGLFMCTQTLHLRHHFVTKTDKGWHEVLTPFHMVFTKKRYAFIDMENISHIHRLDCSSAPAINGAKKIIHFTCACHPNQ